MKKKTPDLDKFYTDPKIAELCIGLMSDILKIDIRGGGCRVLEPSAGNGAFSLQIAGVESYDIDPQHESITKADFLELIPKNPPYITIGNPPFGKRSRLAISFFNRAAKFSHAIGFVLPYQFQKWGVQKRLNPDFQLILNEKLPPRDIFWIEGELCKSDLRTVFQVWVKRTSKWGDQFEDLRIKNSPLLIKNNEVDILIHNATPETAPLVDKEWTIALYRQGYKDYKKIFTREDQDFIRERIKMSSDQFIFFNIKTKEAEKIVEKIDFEELARQNSVVPGFGKADFLLAYERIKEKTK